MENIRQFNKIEDYAISSNLRIPGQRADFFMHSWNGEHDEACLNALPYRNHYFEIIFEMEAGCELSIDQFVFPAGESRLFFISPYRLLTCKEGNPTHPGSGFSILFKPEFIHVQSSNPRLLHDFPYFNHQQSPGIILDQASKNDILELITRMRHEYEHNSIYGREIIKNYLHILLLKGTQLYEQTTVSRTGFGRDQKIYNDFMLLVQEHFLKTDTVADYAKQLYISPKHLSETVKKVSGQSALQIIHHARVHHAKSLMKQTSLTIAQIAQELNFENPDYFSVFFRRLTGETPTQFRNS